MNSLFPNKAPIKGSLKPENIKFSELRSFTLRDETKVFQWPDQHAGNCTLQFPQLFLYPDGMFEFSGNLSSSGSNDSWGILHIDVQQDNGLVLWSSGSFWSPTIGDWAPWDNWLQYPKYLFDTITHAQFWSHC
jgi:Family of unknown function (DUF6294)